MRRYLGVVLSFVVGLPLTAGAQKFRGWTSS
jgi:hypothetical protein